MNCENSNGQLGKMYLQAAFIALAHLFALIGILLAPPSASSPLFYKYEEVSSQWNLNSNVFDNFDLSCTLHFIELHSNFPYSSVKRPFKMTKAHDKEGRYPAVERTIFKTRHQNCLTQLLLTPSTSPEVSKETWWPLKKYMRNVLRRKTVHVYQNHTFLVFVLSQLVQGQDTTMATAIADTLQLSNRPQAHIALMAYQMDKSSVVRVNFGLYQCSYCSNADLNGWTVIRCTQGILCYEDAKAAAEKSSVDYNNVYRIDEEAGSNYIQSAQQPFHFHTMNKELIDAASIGFILESCNLSWPAPRFESTKEIARFALSEILSMPDDPFTTISKDNYEFYLVGKSRGLRFITSDGVTERKEAMSTLTSFLPGCWVALGASMVISALAVAIVCGTEAKESRFQLFWLSLLWTCRVVLENCHGETPSTEMKSCRLIRCCKIVLSFWLITGIIVSNAYKGAVKSSYFVQPVYETHWKRLEEIQNFSFFTIVSSDRRLCTIDSGKWKYNETDARFATDVYDFPLYSEMFHYDRATRYGDFEANENVKLIYRILMNITYVCKTSLDNVMDNELSEKRTATVLLAEELDKYYKIFFERARKTPKGLYFAHNNDGDDGFLIRPRAFGIEKGAMRHQKTVRDRIKVLLSSGVYFMWEKWEQLNAHGEQSKWEPSQDPQALSTENENVLLIFCILAAGLFVASVRFSFEKGYEALVMVLETAWSTVARLSWQLKRKIQLQMPCSHVIPPTKLFKHVRSWNH